MKHATSVVISWLLVALVTVTHAETVEEILENNAKALGGRELLDKIKDVTKEGKIKIIPISPPASATEGTLKSYYKKPDKAYMTQTMGTRVITEAVNGKTYWNYDSRANEPGPKVVVGARAEQRLEDAKLDNTYPAKYSTLGVIMELLGTEKVGDREAFVIRMTRPFGTQTKEYFDKETWLLLKKTTGDSEIAYSDWREVSGVKYPFRIVATFTKHTTEITWDSIKVNTDIPDSQFDLPTK